MVDRSVLIWQIFRIDPAPKTAVGSGLLPGRWILEAIRAEPTCPYFRCRLKGSKSSLGIPIVRGAPSRLKIQPPEIHVEQWGLHAVTNHHCPTILPLNREARISKKFSSWAMFGLLRVVADKSHMNLRLSRTKGTNHKAHVCLVMRWMCKRSTCEEQKPVRFTVIVWFLSMIHAVVETHTWRKIFCVI